MPSCDLFRPSDYTGLMMRALRAGVSGYRRGSGLDMGVGSGVLLATLGELGVQRLVGRGHRTGGAALRSGDAPCDAPAGAGHAAPRFAVGARGRGALRYRGGESAAFRRDRTERS
jgi:hypothetical protein